LKLAQPMMRCVNGSLDGAAGLCGGDFSSVALGIRHNF